jgi:hypothetical protein
LAWLRPDRRDFFTTQGVLLHQRAAELAIRHMAPSGVENVDNAANLFLFSMLTVYFGKLTPFLFVPSCDL